MTVKNDKSVWLVVIDDHRSGTEYRICDSIQTARKVFEDIVRDNYFDDSEEEERLLKEQLESDTGGEWEYSVGDYVSYFEYDILTMADLTEG